MLTPAPSMGSASWRTLCGFFPVRWCEGGVMRRSLLAAVACLGARGGWKGRGGGLSAQSGAALGVYEAVFRSPLEKPPADVGAFLAVDSRAPPAELLSRLRRDWPNLKPASE